MATVEDEVTRMAKEPEIRYLFAQGNILQKVEFRKLFIMWDIICKDGWSSIFTGFFAGMVRYSVLIDWIIFESYSNPISLDAKFLPSAIFFSFS